MWGISLPWNFSKYSEIGGNDVRLNYTFGCLTKPFRTGE